MGKTPNENKVIQGSGSSYKSPTPELFKIVFFTSNPSYQTLGQKVIDILQISHAGHLSG